MLTSFKAFVEEKEEKAIDYGEFKQLFMKLCDVERELIHLGFVEEARRTETVAKTLLHRLIEENEKVREAAYVRIRQRDCVDRWGYTLMVMQAYIAEIAEAPAREIGRAHV